MPSLLPKRVLVIDDDEGDYVLLDAQLEEAGAPDTEWVASSDAGLEVMLEHRHELVFVDYHLDHRDGVQLIRDARERGFVGPVILLTGASDVEVELAGARAGASDFLIKGRFTARELERAMRFALSQHRLERARVARTQAEASVRLKDEFVASVAHELRGPIHAIRLASELILTHGLPPTLSQPMDLLRGSLDKLGRLVEDILDTARAQRGELVLVLEEIDLAHLTTVALQYHAYRARSVGLTLVEELEPVRIRGDATRLTQVIDNLVRNALTHAGEGGSVGVRLAEVPGGGARIEVRDSGPGVEPGSEETIFDAYAQIGAGGQRGEGLGLGLHLVRLIVEAHGGSVRCENDGGAVFTIVLPPEPPE